MKIVSPKPTSPAANDGVQSEQSGVQLSRQALCEQRMNEIYDDVQAGRCDFQSATNRLVEAALAWRGHWFTPRGRAEVEALLRESCERDPRLRNALERR